jgi:hypothetical protein
MASSEPAAVLEPILTAKSLYISFGICVIAGLLLYAMYSVAAYMKRRRQPLIRAYHDKFDRLMIEMKEVIDLGEKHPEFYGHRSDNFRTREHILYIFRHIDKMTKDGRMPHHHGLEGGGKYSVVLTEVIIPGFELEEGFTSS